MTTWATAMLLIAGIAIGLFGLRLDPQQPVHGNRPDDVLTLRLLGVNTAMPSLPRTT